HEVGSRFHQRAEVVGSRRTVHEIDSLLTHLPEAYGVQRSSQPLSSDARLDEAIAADAADALSSVDHHSPREDRSATDRLAAFAFDRDPRQSVTVRVILIQPGVALAHIAGIDLPHQPNDVFAVAATCCCYLELFHRVVLGAQASLPACRRE